MDSPHEFSHHYRYVKLFSTSNELHAQVSSAPTYINFAQNNCTDVYRDDIGLSHCIHLDVFLSSCILILYMSGYYVFTACQWAAPWI